MSDPLLAVGGGPTPLDDDARAGLKPAWITTRADLNNAEQENILKATTNRRQPTVQALLTEAYLRNLHKAMFGDVWSWAGSYRQTNPNIGCQWPQIAGNVLSLVRDDASWIEVTAYPLDEMAVRFHYRLVTIHPFPSGNGRHSRQAALYLAGALDARRPTWGASLGLSTPDLRRTYIDALIEADRSDDVSALVTFSLS